MSKFVKITKGLNINLLGEAEKVLVHAQHPDTIAIKPTDILGLTPKLAVAVGDKVEAGTPLFFDKGNEKIKVVSPVSGEVIEINRGEKRKILEIKVLTDKEIRYKEFKKADPKNLSREEILETLLSSGAWPFIRQRPFAIMANPNDMPKSIFISAFDSNPLAPDNDFIVHSNGEDFQTGLDAICKLTSGKVHLNINADATPSKVFTNSKGVQINKISGKHPAGNVGVQIHHIDPVNKGEVVWYLYPQDVLLIGRLFNQGKFDATRVVALTGAQVKSPKYYKTYIGASVKSITSDNSIALNSRYISGNVLTGTKVSPEGYLGFYDSQMTIIPEGDYYEFMGWLMPGLNKLSNSRAFFSWLSPNKKYNLDTNLHGEHRAFVVTGEYEKVFPFDIYPVQLLKAIIVEDIEMIEKLGIYEVAEEDFALCEFVCTSKIDVQKIVRQGLDLIKKEMS